MFLLQRDCRHAGLPILTKNRVELSDIWKSSAVAIWVKERNNDCTLEVRKCMLLVLYLFSPKTCKKVRERDNKWLPCVL